MRRRLINSERRWTGKRKERMSRHRKHPTKQMRRRLLADPFLLHTSKFDRRDFVDVDAELRQARQLVEDEDRQRIRSTVALADDGLAECDGRCDEPQRASEVSVAARRSVSAIELAPV
jgi:hypothetical protein